MTKTKSLWLGLAIIYGIFFSWYTSFGGPLTDEEIDHYMTVMRDGGASPEQLARVKKFMEEDTGDDFMMINVIDFYDTPLAVEGVDPEDTTDEVMDKYMAYMDSELIARASHPVFFGTATNTAMDIMNADGMEQWTRGAGMRYRSRRDMLQITMNEEFQGAHKYKVAAMEKTIAFPTDPWFQIGDPRFVLFLILSLIGSTLSWFWATRKNT